MEWPPQGKGSRTWGPSTLPPHPGNWSAPNNVNFVISMHFLRQFQQQSSIQWCTPPSQLSPQPGGCTTLLVTTPNCSGGRCRALEPQDTPHPASPEGAVSVQGRRKKVSMALHLLGVSGQVLIPKGQNQHPKPKTQPRLQEEDYTRLHSPFQLRFLLDFGANPGPPSLRCRWQTAPFTRQVTPMGRGLSMGHCHKLADGYRSLPTR